jgi:DNA repair protein RadC
MKTVATNDRPREKLARLGPAALGDNELLAIVLGHGHEHASALDLANAVLADAGGLHGVLRARHESLMRLRGIGAARAAQVLAAIELGRRTLTRAGLERVQLTSPRQVAEFLLPLYGARPVEQFGVLLFDTKNQVLRTRVLSVGTLDASIVHPREVFREAVAANAASIVLFHNHPSGDPEPSDDDIQLTRRFVAAGMLMGITVIDHIILGDVRYCSLREKGTFTRGEGAAL